MTDCREPDRAGARVAARIRRQAGVQHAAPVCVFDVAEALGVDVWFRPEKTLEGMYVKSQPPRILVGTHRPAGRRSFSCAHELGHHVFGHGSRIDEVQEQGQSEETPSDPEERLATIFAAHLLMPVAAVREAFGRRGWNIKRPTPEQVLAVADFLGVGYATLITQLDRSLRLLDRGVAAVLRRSTPKALRHALLGRPPASNVVQIDRFWWARPVDLAVGDLAVLPESCRLEGAVLATVARCQPGVLVEAVRPGIGRAETADSRWATFLRVSPQDYVGRSIFRHLPDDDD